MNSASLFKNFMVSQGTSLRLFVAITMGVGLCILALRFSPSHATGIEELGGNAAVCAGKNPANSLAEFRMNEQRSTAAVVGIAGGSSGGVANHSTQDPAGSAEGSPCDGSKPEKENVNRVVANAKNSPIFFPSNRHVLISGKFVIIGRTDEDVFRLNGRAGVMESVGSNVRIAPMQIAPGTYRLDVEGHRHEFVVALNEREHDGPNGWPVVRWHPMEGSAEGCRECHHGPPDPAKHHWRSVPIPEACFGCHPVVKLEAIHAHPMEHLHQCQDCHSVHSAREPYLLKGSVRELCSACHES